MGGLISENKLKSKKGIPILGQIPILDLIFGNKEDRATKTELVIFITPHIVRDAQMADVDPDASWAKVVEEAQTQQDKKKK
jgi:general secretion pathway protein D